MIRFTKMHGIGNDYLYLDAVREPALAARPDLAELARKMSDRHRGVGADGIIVISRPDAESGLSPTRSVRMRMFNADGSEGEMCGNGIRCVAKYAVDHDLVPDDAKPLRIQTGAGVLSLDYARDASGRVVEVTVDMGAPILELPRIPVDSSKLVEAGQDSGRIALDGHGVDFEATFVSMGNPHAVIFADADSVDLARIGPLIERHPAFPKRINAHFVSIVSATEVVMRTWERGSGITQACGTGASAVCVAGVLRGQTERTILAHLPGGDLRLRWDEASDHVFMTGPAVEVFSGEWPD
ncbi:MAG: diaminopimelate epimerase [Phycisphaerales bacterium]